jgi:methyl-accepting chemotaxis protein
MIFAFGFVAALVAVVAVTALSGLNRVSASVNQVVVVDGNLRNLAQEIAVQTLLCRRYEKDFFLNLDNPTDRTQYLEKWDAAFAGLQQAIQKFSLAASLREDQQQVDSWRVDSRNYQLAFEQVRNSIQAGTITTPQAANTALTPAKESIRTLTDSSMTVAHNKVTAAAQAEAALKTIMTNTTGLVMGGAAVALVLAAGWGLLFPSRLMRPIAALHKTTGRLAGGDRTARITLSRNDELGMLAQSFNQMADTIEQQFQAGQLAREQAIQRSEVERQAKEHLEQIVDTYLRFVERVATGDLTARVVINDDNDTLGKLGQGLNSMVGNLHTITKQVQQANANIAAAAAEILAATTQQAASAAEQSAALTQTSTTIEEVKVIAQQTAQQATQVAQDSQLMLSVAQHGTEAVEETVRSMAQIKERVGSIAETILALAEQTQEISTIITTVSELTDQSNLLALNAAIEAARAGEQGKSFAVVAQHVRTLAERAKAATVQVRDILSEIQRATNKAVLVTEEGTKGVEAGSHLATQAGQVIHRMTGEVGSGAQANVQMAAAAQQQTAGMEQIGQAMGVIQQATTQALASTRQAERTAQSLHSLAQSLQHTVSAYQL